MKPAGEFVATDMHEAGGVALVGRELLAHGLADGTAHNVDGRTLQEICAAVRERPGQRVVGTVASPYRSQSELAVLRGNLAPEGCVLKLAGSERSRHEGPARVFDSEEEAFAAFQAGAIQANDVIVIRYEGPHGGPGMRESST